MKTKPKRVDSVQISISLPPDVALALSEQSARERRPRSTIVCLALEKYLGIYDTKTAAMIREAKNTYNAGQ